MGRRHPLPRLPRVPIARLPVTTGAKSKGAVFLVTLLPPKARLLNAPEAGHGTLRFANAFLSLLLRPLLLPRPPSILVTITATKITMEVVVVATAISAALLILNLAPSISALLALMLAPSLV